MNNYEGNTFFINDVDDSLETDMIVPLIKEIENQSKRSNGRIDIWVNSFGGYAHLAFQIVSLMELAKRNDIVVRTMVNSVAYSAGSIIAIAGTPGERYIDKDAEHLLHLGYTGSGESTVQQLERNYAQKNGHFKHILNHYNKYADVPDLETHLSDDSFFVNSAKCIKYKLADKYLEKFVIL